MALLSPYAQMMQQYFKTGHNCLITDTLQLIFLCNHPTIQHYITYASKKASLK
jgi:hypothetical protein